MVKKNGFTLIELIVVLTIIVVISAIAVPKFASIVEKSKLKTDVQSAKVINGAINLYNAESDSFTSPLASLGSDATAIIAALQTKEYLDEKAITIQTQGASWVLDGEVIKLQINTTLGSLSTNYSLLTANEQAFVKTSS